MDLSSVGTSASASANCYAQLIKTILCAASLFVWAGVDGFVHRDCHQLWLCAGSNVKKATALQGAAAFYFEFGVQPDLQPDPVRP